MRISRFLACFALPLALTVPVAAFAQQPGAGSAAAAKLTPAQVQSAVKNSLQSVNLTPRQKLQIKPMLENYQQQTAGADAATKKSAQEALLKNIYGVLTPQQQAEFKASMKAQIQNDMSQSGASH